MTGKTPCVPTANGLLIGAECSPAEGRSGQAPHDEKNSKKVLTRLWCFVIFGPHIENNKQQNMRTTKALLLAAGIAAAGLASSMAQTVYSVNVVGFVNMDLGAGYTLICPPLQASNNTVAAILPTVPDGTTISKWDPTNQTFFSPVTYDSGIFGGWDVPDTEISPGEAVFINLGAPATITFVGEVRQGTLNTPLYAGFSMVGSQVPQAGGVTTTLGWTPTDGDTAAQWDPVNQTYFSPSTYDVGIFGGWDIEPVLAVGEGIVATKAASGSWTRTFNVNP